MAIRLNFSLGTREVDGQVRPFGKIGFQTMNPNVDRFMAKNLADIEKALDAGTLRNLDGELVKDRAHILIVAQVDKVQPTEALEGVPTIRNATGDPATVPTEAPAADATEDDIPF